MKLLKDVPVIYIVYCMVTGKCYVGQSVQFNTRKRNHLSAAKRGSLVHYEFYNDLRKYDKKEFKWSVIYCDRISELTELEKYWSDKLDSIKDGYNSIMPGTEYTPEWRKKVSEANRGKKLSQETRKKMSKAHIGMLHTEEEKLKISQSHIGKKFSEQHRKNLSKAFLGNKRCLGRIVSPETRAKISKTLIGKPSNLTSEGRIRLTIANRNRKKSAEAISKVIAFHTGRKRSVETCAKISAAKKGKKYGIETRRRMSEGQLRRHKNLKRQLVSRIVNVFNSIQVRT